MLAAAPETEMEERVGAGAETFSVAVALTPFSVAVTVAEPGATAVARPAALIVAAA